MVAMLSEDSGSNEAIYDIVKILKSLRNILFAKLDITEKELMREVQNLTSKISHLRKNE